MGENDVMDRKAGRIVGLLSLLPVLISIITFFIMRGPNVDVYLMIIIHSILSFVGIVLAIISLVKNQILLFFLGLLGNGLVLVFAFFLLLAMGIGEP